ncbi:MAG: hypothetical protein IPN95_22045 [Bacteroidetes bacterium]|nr:hypothetical protein [Bacteroidota bacterium]MBL0017533.1 hypothetical protein [Bacteroidota bacterium]MBP6640637.1 hypothetical protein [Bacteroidia bacterium]
MKTRTTGLRKILAGPLLMGLGLAFLLLSSGCGGPDTCKCLEEADKENPNQEFMEQCRVAFSEMEMAEVEAAVKKCGR